MLKHPFYKYSFCLLLLVDIAYASALVITHSAPLSSDTFIAATVWFVSFYWLPVWTAAALIFYLRGKGYSKVIVEWLVAVMLMALGNVITDNLLISLYKDYKPLGVFVIFNGLIWGSCIYFLSIYIESKQKVAAEKHSRKKAQLATLRYQLNPHFMFNSLNTISAYIRTNPELADEVLHELADILRYSLDTADQALIPLEQELAIVEKYLNIEKARFGEKLQINYCIPEQLKSIQIPPLIIQPIIENAIKHNAQQSNLTLEIEVIVMDKGIQVKVSDNGKGFNEHVLNQGCGLGVGMKNIQKRVNQLGKSKITLSNNNGAVVCLELVL